MKKLLLTGFVPFLDFSINPSSEIVHALNGQTIGDYKVIGHTLPVEFASSSSELLRLYDEIKPDAVLSLGLAGGRNSITPERVAINCCDGAADNSGVKLEDAPIVADGPAAYFSTLPIRAFINRWKQEGLPTEISNTAGLYLCNNVMYTMLHQLHQEGSSIPAGFIHIPASHELAAASKRSMPSWSITTLIEAVRLAVDELSLHTADKSEESMQSTAAGEQ